MASLLRASPQQTLAPIDHRSLEENCPSARSSAMALRLSLLQVNGEMLDLEVMPGTTGRELKQKIRDERQLTWDEVTCRTTIIEILVGDRLLRNDEPVADVGLMSVIFKPNTVTCSSVSELAKGALQNFWWLNSPPTQLKLQSLPSETAKCWPN